MRDSRWDRMEVPLEDGGMTAAQTSGVAGGASGPAVDDEERLVAASDRYSGDDLLARDLERPPRRGAGSSWSPAVEVFEHDGEFVIHVELPGVRREDVKVEISDDALTVQGERRRSFEENRPGFYRSERHYGRFFRQIPVPAWVDEDRASAHFDNGLLEVRIPILETQHRRREIPIQERTARPPSMPPMADRTQPLRAMPMTPPAAARPEPALHPGPAAHPSPADADWWRQAAGPPPPVTPERLQDPSWWTRDDDSAWARVKDAFRRDWEQTKHDGGGEAPDLNQDAGDTLAQATGREPDYAEFEPAFRFGYGARRHYGKQYPEWNDELEAQLWSDWRATHTAQEDDWPHYRRAVRRGWDANLDL